MSKQMHVNFKDLILKLIPTDCDIIIEKRHEVSITTDGRILRTHEERDETYSVYILDENDNQYKIGNVDEFEGQLSEDVYMDRCFLDENARLLLVRFGFDVDCGLT